MASITVFASAGVDDSTVGSSPWLFTDRVTADDGLPATANSTPSPTHYLRSKIGDVSSIPSDSIIDGIIISMGKWESLASNNFFDNLVRLYKSGTGFVGNNKADTVTEWSTTETLVSYGGATDLWGVAWTRSEVLNMEVGLSATFATVPGGRIDYVKFTIHYTPPVLKSLSGASTNSGVLTTAITVLKALVGACTNSGSLITIMTILKALSGASTNAGALATQVFTTISKALSGVSTNAGALAMLINRFVSLSGASTNTGVLSKLRTITPTYLRDRFEAIIIKILDS